MNMVYKFPYPSQNLLSLWNLYRLSCKRVRQWK